MVQLRSSIAFKLIGATPACAHGSCLLLIMMPPALTRSVPRSLHLVSVQLNALLLLLINIVYVYIVNAITQSHIPHCNCNNISSFTAAAKHINIFVQMANLS